MVDYKAQTRDNEARNRASEERGDLVVGAWPLKIFFEFTADCNLHCFMCGCEIARDTYRAAGHRRFSLPVKAFRLAVRRAFPHIALVTPTAVGEPMMLAYFDELVEACREYHVKLDLVSNGMLLKEHRLRPMMPWLDTLSISFDGATKKTFDHIRTGADFNVVMRNLETFRQLRRDLDLRDSITFSFNVTIMHENVDELPDIVRIAHRLDVDNVTGNFMLVFGDELRKSSPLRNPERTNRALEEARQVARDLGIEVRMPHPLTIDSHENIVVETVCGLDRIESSQSTTDSVSLEANHQDVPATENDASRVETVPKVEQSPISLTRPPNWPGKYYCRFPWREAFVSQGGEVSPCCSPGRPTFGNAYETDFMPIWNGPEYQRLRDGLVSGNLTDYCRDCTYLQESGQLDFDGASYLNV